MTAYWLVSRKNVAAAEYITLECESMTFGKQYMLMMLQNGGKLQLKWYSHHQQQLLNMCFIFSESKTL